jgi:hypothetical protein
VFIQEGGYDLASLGPLVVATLDGAACWGTTTTRG